MNDPRRRARRQAVEFSPARLARCRAGRWFSVARGIASLRFASRASVACSPDGQGPPRRARYFDSVTATRREAQPREAAMVGAWVHVHEA